MFNLKKSMMFLGIGILLFSGCKADETKPENSMREVSSEFRGFGKRASESEEWKESGVLYEDRVVEFQDSIVEGELRNMIGKPEGEVYISDLQEIHKIHLDGEKLGGTIHNLNDLSYCYNLQWLGFSSIEVPSLESLSSLPQLESLNFSAYVSITEDVLEDIGNLSELKYLYIGNNEVVDWGELTDGSFLLPLAEQLIELWAAGGIDWNPEVLAQMTNLENLLMEYEDDLSFLEQMTGLKQLRLYCCTPENWNLLSFLENLEYLTILGNMYTTIDIELEDLRALKKLDYLSLAFTSINTEYSYQEVVDALPSLTGLVTQ